MRFGQAFFPTLKEAPADAEVASHKRGTDSQRTPEDDT